MKFKLYLDCSNCRSIEAASIQEAITQCPELVGAHVVDKTFAFKIAYENSSIQEGVMNEVTYELILQD